MESSIHLFRTKLMSTNDDLCQIIRQLQCIYEKTINIHIRYIGDKEEAADDLF